MARARSKWVCQACGTEQGQWYGTCPRCNGGELVEEVVPASRPQSASGSLRVGNGVALAFEPLAQVRVQDVARVPSGIGELDRVLGGGIVPGGVVLIGGEPGVGKSTLMGMLARNVARAGRTVAYISGEESLAQIRLRHDRLGDTPASLLVLAATDLEDILESIERQHPDLVVLDSIQTVTSSSLEGAAGSVGQVRRAAHEITRLAKAKNIPVFLIGHVTKEGQLAGPRVIEHTVDAVLHLEGDRFHLHRMLRAAKNRFGSADEIGVFRMGEHGMEEVSNPSDIFLSETSIGAPGSVVTATVEGSRPLLVEVQALTAPASASFPRRTVNGLDVNRIHVVCATLGRLLPVHDRDVYVNLTGGMRSDDPACDLAVALAIASATTGKPLPQGTVVAGEVGLTGEIRRVAQIENRLKEAARLGFTTAVVPRGRTGAPAGLTITEVTSLEDCLRRFGFARARGAPDRSAA